MAVFVLMTGSLAGCVTSTNYAAVQEAMKGSPELMAKMVDDCAGSYRGASQDRDFLSKLARIPNDKNLPKVICTRAYKGIASGRITYDDFQSMSHGDVRPVVVKVLQNR